MGDVDWAGWLRRWDAQQEGYHPDREARFTAMLDALEQLVPAEFTAVDLACGPGSLSERLLARFPGARVVAVDMDPAMIALGEGALGTVGGRLRWVEADLDDPGWTAALDGERVDAVLSTTALHWLHPGPLERVYGELGRLLPEGGIVLNGDTLAYPPALTAFGRLAEHAFADRWTDEAFAARGAETAEQWWAAFAKEPGTAPLLEARAALYAGKVRQETPPGYDDHVAALRAAGFREVDPIWQVLSDRVLLAVR
jgi:trans-aconitate methyltransferase